MHRDRSNLERHSQAERAAAHGDRPATCPAPAYQLEELPMSGAVIIGPFIPRIEADAPGGFFVIQGNFGWLFGSRREALIAARELAQEARQ